MVGHILVQLLTFLLSIGQFSDPGTGEVTGQKCDKKYLSKLCTRDIRKDHMLTVQEIMRIQKKQRIQDSKIEKKYACEKCAQTYTHKCNLTAHQKYECNVLPQYSCKLCYKLFERISHLNRHVRLIHLKSNSETSKMKYNCNNCNRNYSFVYTFNRHQSEKHATVV